MALRKTASPAVKLDSLSDVNDLGKPWRFTDEDTGLTVTRSCVWSPPGCHPVGCGLKLYTDESGRLVKVEGDENHPVTQGRLCVRCIALKDYEYNNSRILHPMRSATPRLPANTARKASSTLAAPDARAACRA